MFIHREPKNQLDKPQAPFRSTLKVNLKKLRLNLGDDKISTVWFILKEKNEKWEKSQPAKLVQINEILDSLKEKKTVSEMNLSEALKQISDKSQYEKASFLLEKVSFLMNWTVFIQVWSL